MLITDFDYDLPLELIAQISGGKEGRSAPSRRGPAEGRGLSQKVLRYFRLSSAGRLSRHE